MKSQHDLLVLLESVYNEKNPEKLKGHVSRNLIYESQWVILPITGSSNFHAFMKEKFDTIRKSKAILKAAIRFSPKTGEEYIELRQGDMSEVACCVLIKSEKGCISRIDIVIPAFY